MSEDPEQQRRAIRMAPGDLTPLRISPHAWWGWVLLLFAEDLSYYWYHRVGHEVRLFWASHVKPN